jgi:hypothetical protein
MRILTLVSDVVRDSNYKALAASTGSLALEESRNYKAEMYISFYPISRWPPCLE